MGKSQLDKAYVFPNVVSTGMSSKKNQTEMFGDIPPEIPPRMKKRGPAIPEKPPHIRAKFNTMTSSQPSLRPRTLPPVNLDKQQGTQREVLVAASRAVRERPVDKRQREPAKLLTPTTGAPPKKELAILPSKSNLRLEDCISVPLKKAEPRTDSSKNSTTRKSRPVQPILLIPRNLLTWGTAPVSYALWMQRDAPPNRGVARREPVKQHPRDKFESSTTSARARSGSVARSGSLTSQGSSCSDSGNETFPKSVLKKQKRNTPNSTSKGSSNRKMEQKKNVTFNAFATVQLMENE